MFQNKKFVNKKQTARSGGAGGGGLGMAGSPKLCANVTLLLLCLTTWRRGYAVKKPNIIFVMVATEGLLLSTVTRVRFQHR